MYLRVLVVVAVIALLLWFFLDYLPKHLKHLRAEKAYEETRPHTLDELFSQANKVASEKEQVLKKSKEAQEKIDKIDEKLSE